MRRLYRKDIRSCNEDTVKIGTIFLLTDYEYGQLTDSWSYVQIPFTEIVQLLYSSQLES